MVSFKIEQTTTGMKIRAIRVSPTGKEVSRVIGRVKANDYAAADRIMNAYSA